ncbi:hypothetical protein [Flavobacterium sp. CAU 1735]|uniref:hypothetical protein n=1 Tax=Flavobacterium sp. CAU 1735 TaxID=3140361 RepID=UPI0032604F11
MEDIHHYTNANGTKITIEKTKSDYLPDYLFETYSENDTIIHKKNYINGELSNIAFYAYSEADIDRLVNEQNGTASITFIYTQNAYQVTEDLTYTDHILTDKRITVTDANANIICYKKYEPKEGVLTCVLTDKSYYKDNVNIYDFEYYPDSSCFMITSVQTYQEDIFAWDIGTDATDFTWNGFEYYQNAEPLVPEK